MLSDAHFKRAIAFFGTVPITFQNNAASSPAGVKLLNFTGSTNSSLGLNSTAFNASEISNFTTSNFTALIATTTYARTITLPESLFPLFDSATEASQLQSALSNVTIQVSTTTIQENHAASDNFISVPPTDNVVPTQLTPTEPAAKATTSGDSSPSRMALQPFSESLVLSMTVSSTPTKTPAAQSTASSSEVTTLPSKPTKANTQHTVDTPNHDPVGGRISSNKSEFGVTSASSTFVDQSRANTSSNSTKNSSTSANKVSGTSVPNLSMFNSNRASTGTHERLLTASPSNFAGARQTSGIPGHRPSILSQDIPTAIGVLDPTSNSSIAMPGGAMNFSANTKSLESMLGDALKPNDCEGASCKEITSPVPIPLTLNFTATRFSNSSSKVSGNDVDIDAIENDAEAMLKDINTRVAKQVCEDIPEMRATPLCLRIHAAFNHPVQIPPNATTNAATVEFNYTKYFQDLNDLTIFPDEEEIPDDVYFEMDDKNFEESMAVQWYASWTVIAQGTPEWDKHGEWELFWRQYLKEPNFSCQQGFASCNYQPPSVADIVRLFPKNRPLGRRVLFTTMIWGVMHDYTNQLDTRFKDTILRFDTIIPDFVKTFTLQVNSDKARLCDIYKAIIQIAIDLVIDIAIGVFTDGVGQVLVNRLQEMVENEVTKVTRMIQAQRFRNALARLEKDLKSINLDGEFKTVTESIGRIKTQKINTLRDIEDKILKHTRFGAGEKSRKKYLEELERLEREKKVVQSSLKDVGLLHATYVKQGLEGDEAKEATLKAAVRYMKEDRVEPEHLDNTLHSLGIHNLDKQPILLPEDALQHVDFPLSKTAEDWSKTLVTNIAQQMAWNQMQHIPQQWFTSYYHHGDKWNADGRKEGTTWENALTNNNKWSADRSQEETTWVNALTNSKAYRAWPRNKLKEHREQAQAGLKGGVVELPTIIGGSGTGWVCSEFEGDWKDLNSENVDLLRQRYNAELHNGRRQVWMLYKDMYDGAVPEPGRPSMVARWMLARKWVGKNEEGTIEYDLHHAEDFHKRFELGYIKDLASVTLSAGYNYVKCSHREDAIEKCTKTGDEYESLFCPEPETDPTLECQAARWYFSDTEPHEIDMVAIRSIESFGALHGFSFNKNEMLQEIWESYKKFGNHWGARDWGIRSIEIGDHPRGFHIPVCTYDDNTFDTHEHQRPWWKNFNFPATCGNHAANETADFMNALTLGPGSAKHKITDWTFADRVPRVLWDKSPYTTYMSMCELGLRWPHKDFDDNHFWNRYTVKTSKDTVEKYRNCGKRGWPDCPEGFKDRDWGDQDCAMIKTATLHMDELEANAAFCTNAMGHTIFERDAPHVWAGLYPLSKWQNNEYRCGEWLGNHGVRAMEAVSKRTLDAAEMGIGNQTLPKPLTMDAASTLDYLSPNATAWDQAPKANVTEEEERHSADVLAGWENDLSLKPVTSKGGGR